MFFATGIGVCLGMSKTTLHKLLKESSWLNSLNGSNDCELELSTAKKEMELELIMGEGGAFLGRQIQTKLAECWG